ncbi:MAG: uracil-DNA glycosylase [Gemmatimonadota bacterium]
MRDDEGCWRGRDDTTPYVPGRPRSVPSARTLSALFDAMACCTRCDLAPGRTQVVPGVGRADARVLLIGEAPGAQEDRAGRPFVGRAGELLDALLERARLERNDVFITNVVACRPPGNRTPRAREVAAHSPWLEQQIRLVAPELLVTLGRVALTYFVPGAKVTELRGRPLEVERDGRTIRLLPVVHPAAALRRRSLRPELERDFERIGRLLGGSPGGGG